ncbi:hypothetical protein BKA70DRAFT_1225985 [Coprinopsis sp. MPI-PUGE-AT-0042]|nr:hypothetical protein BKA70DRAFT_1225985 [Coprinopsis sp. MPI-PUGE-AT-0042]
MQAWGDEPELTASWRWMELPWFVGRKKELRTQFCIGLIVFGEGISDSVPSLAVLAFGMVQMTVECCWQRVEECALVEHSSTYYHNQSWRESKPGIVGKDGRVEGTLVALRKPQLPLRMATAIRRLMQTTAAQASAPEIYPRLLLTYLLPFVDIFNQRLENNIRPSHGAQLERTAEPYALSRVSHPERRAIQKP